MKVTTEMNKHVKLWTYFSTWQYIVWSPSLVTLKVFDVNDTRVYGTIADGSWKAVFLNSWMWHGTVVVCSVGSTGGGVSRPSLIHTAIGANGGIRDVGRIIQRRIEGLERRQAEHDRCKHSESGNQHNEMMMVQTERHYLKRY